MPDSTLDALPLFRSRSTPSPARVQPASERPFAAFVRSFDKFGQSSAEFREHGIAYLANEFWTAGQRQAHAIHEISYRACFKPQLPEFFIGILTRPGESVYDPFLGRGTTPIQAALMGRRAIGNDINPLSLLLTRPRLCSPSLALVARRLEEVDWRAGRPDNDDLLAFYSERTLRQICALRSRLIERAPLGVTPDPALDWIRMVALNRLSGHSPGFFSVYTLPPNQAVSVRAQRKINESRNQVPPERNVARIILKKTRALLSDGPLQSAAPFLLTTAPAHATPFIPDHSVSLVVTSPPFLDIVQYADDNWLRCWFAGIDVRSVAITQYRTEAAWQGMVRDTLTELGRIVRPGGYVAFEVGEVRNGRVLLERLVWEAAEGLPFERLFVMINRQAFTKTANCWGIRNNAKGTNTNRIVVLRRTGGCLAGGA